MQVDILFVRPGERDGDRGDVRRGGHGRGRHHWLSRVHGQSSIGLTFFEAQRIEGKSNYNLMLVIKNGIMYHDQGSTKNQNVFLVLFYFPVSPQGSPPFQIFGSAPLGGRGVWLVGTKSQLFLKIQNGGSPESFPTRRLFYLNNVLSLKNKSTKRITIIALLIHDRHQTMLNPPKISEKPPKENRALPIEQVFTFQILYNGRI